MREAKARGRPYTIVFVGVNGVGKSTNLAKVAYWLLQNDVSVRACFGTCHWHSHTGCCSMMCRCAPVLAPSHLPIASHLARWGADASAQKSQNFDADHNKGLWQALLFALEQAYYGLGHVVGYGSAACNSSFSCAHSGIKLTRHIFMYQHTLSGIIGLPRPQVMIAACDTFRSGAVEQLKTHCARLGVPLYERGYEKDPAKVAFEAQRAAARASTDVLLVDTAGAAKCRDSLINRHLQV